MTTLPSDLSKPGCDPVAGTTGQQYSSPGAAHRARSWIPVRTLWPRHRERIVVHLVGLSARDRYFRFGCAASDEHLGRYVDNLDFDRDAVFGIFNRRLQLIAMAHLACTRDGCKDAEFGVSVNQLARGRGLGGRLFEHACLHARNRAVDTLIIHALAENVPMLKIARKAGATVESHGAEAEARIRLPPDSMASRIDQWVAHHAAELDYQLKVRSKRVDRDLGVIDDASADIVE